MGSVPVKTVFGSIDQYEKGRIEIVSGEARHYVFSNVFEVAASSAPYEKVVVGKNMEYVIEALRADGRSAWFTCAHDEFVISMDGEVRVDFLKLDQPATGEGTVLAGPEPAGRPMGHILLGKGHQCLLPTGAAYRFTADRPCALVLQTVLGPLSVQKWKDICLQ
ncbi:hypothetical protein [Lysobacter sp.]|uniref:hypothetical protein n=1 Tax=Lysobacter sp. TaxID=72226 RepID=UPI002D2A28F9|nr:hypothetical protein [Lysobacter sp.]HZX77300.1 hypothetical protein [Lysobacter sp.]